MAENIELREIPGRPGFYYVIKWVNGTAVEKSGIIDMIAYEQVVMDKLGIAQEDMKNIGRDIIDGSSVAVSEFDKYEQALELWREVFREGLAPIDDRGYCLFCPIGLMDRHSQDCIYLRAKALIEETNE